MIFTIFTQIRNNLKKTLVLFAHPFLEYAENSQMFLNFYERNQHFTFRDLYEEYPEFHIAAFRERKRIHEYDRFIFHFPIIWFGMPPLLRLWVDEVIDTNWLKEYEDNPFENKDVYFLITTRSKEKSFGRNGKHHYTVEELISGILVTLKIFKANIRNIYVVYESENLTKKEIIQHKNKFIEILSQ